MGGEYVLGAHALFGVLTLLSAIWLFVELVEPTKSRILRARTISLALTLFAWITYLVGGYYYVTYYSTSKSIILAGPWTWAHKIVMEAKEHIFFAGLLTATVMPLIVWACGEKMIEDKGLRRSTLALLGLLVLGALALDMMGALISMGVRMSLTG